MTTNQPQAINLSMLVDAHANSDSSDEQHNHRIVGFSDVQRL